MFGFTLDITGLDKLNERLSVDRFNDNLAKGVAPAIMNIHKAIESAVFHTYNTNGRKLSSVLVGNRLGKVDRDKLFLSTSLSYVYKPVDLSKFPYTYQHIPENNPGAVHTVEIRRGQRKQVVGKSGNGGFVPRNRRLNTNVWRSPKGYGAQMFERIGKARKPLRLLLGPSLAQMANTAINNGNPEIIQAYNQAVDIIASNLDL